MSYLYMNIIGAFVLDENLKIIDSMKFEDAHDYMHRNQFENKLREKHKGLLKLPEHKKKDMLDLFKDQKYFKEFFAQNIDLTRLQIKNSVTQDQLIIQSIGNIQELDRVINLLSKRLREWYSLYYPELAQYVSNHQKFAQEIVTKTRKEMLQGETMGADLDEVHVKQMKLLAGQILNSFDLQEKHKGYLKGVMSTYCPNVLELAGTTIGAKLIELAKGLKRMALLPASTIQLLGAEKALFRHIKTGARPPKYGAIFHHPIVQNTKRDHRGRAARVLADKLSLCARLDFFKGEFKAPEYKKMLEEKFNVTQN